MLAPSIPVAFLAGLLSFLSPCVLPLVPSYLAYIGGTSPDRRTVLGNSLLFVLGFSLVFVALGASASLLSGLLLASRGLLIRIGGALVIAFGLMLLGVFKLPLLYRTVKAEYRGNASTRLGATLMGMSFAIGWTPCVGVILGGILGLASTSSTVGQGAILLVAYTIGLGLPFLLVASSLHSATERLAVVRRHSPTIMRVGGGLLVLIGLLQMSGVWGAWLNSLRAWIGAYGTVAGPDTSLQSQPANASQVALRKEGISVADVDLFEFNEAFAAVAVQSSRQLNLSDDKVNVNGGAISLGHPVGASGNRIILHLALELGRRGGGTGVAAICGGGGQGDALVLKVPAHS